jgi:thermitase
MMRRLLSAIFALVWAIGAWAQAGAPEYVEGEILVKFRPGFEAAADMARAQVGGVLLENLADIGVERYALPPSIGVKEAVEMLRRWPVVEFAEPNFIAWASFIPNDTYWSSQWGPSKIKCPAGWDINKGSSTVRIAIVDTGIDYSHPDLSGKIVAGYDFANNDSNAQDDNGHGTHCAGIAAALTNNARGIAGVGFNCSLMAVKVLNASGSGTYSAIANGITWAADNGAKVISMSLGGSSGSSTLSSAVSYAWSKGAVLVAAAGNNGSTAPSYPAYYTNCIAVASSTTSDTRSSFSNYGSWVEVAAPGSNILSTYPGGYAYLSGTSMACPHVSGLAGLLWSKLGSTTNSTVRSKIENNCDPVGSWVTKGRINVQKALTN